MASSSNSEVEPILGIQFSIFSPDEIERRSVVEITSNATYEGNEPKIGGLFDPRMGVLENGKQCRSCGQSNNNCPGHFGHYRLARPVYYIQFLPMILNVLSCICINCSRLRVDKELRSSIKSKSGEGRWKELMEASSNISRCGQETEDGCGTRQPNRYKREGIARIVAEWDAIDTKSVSAESMRQPLEVEYVQRLFRRITDEDVAFMGFNPRWCRPDWMVCSFLAIPPPHVRPSVVQENNQRSEDDLTHKLFEIIKTNNMLQTRIDADANKTNKTYVDELTNVLQYHIATLIDNQIPGVAPSAQRGGRPLKSIQQRLGSKEGRIRYNLQGKRVEMSARSVITPDPNISVAELGVPTRIAMNLTQPERVTEYNIDKLYKLVQNGSAIYPGAKTLVRKDGRMISLAHVNTKEIVLYHGDTVNRHLLDGDMVLFNRQPTLHRMSMMGHRVRVLPYNTFRLNVSVTSPYNADFDGDEMNAHIPQSSEAIQELQDIAAVPYQMISPRHQKPVIKVVQDSLLGTYRITKQGDTFTKREYMNLMMWNKRFDGTLPESEIIDGAPRWSGQKVVSALFQSMNMDLKNKFYDDDPSENNMVKIREGAIQASGIVDDDVLNKTGVGVIHTTFNDFGPHAAVELIDSLQSTIEAYLVMSGFSVGLSDLVADEATLSTMNEIVQKRKKEIDEIVLQVHMDLFDNSTGKSNQDEFESQVFGKLNKAIEELGKLGQQALAPQNRMISMLKAGSKGSTINVSQMVACVGQQNIEGRRIPYGFTDRTLPHYKKYDDGAEARGFVENSFVKGLTPQEFFFHAMSGREGLIDTAVKTAETGYIQRQMVKAMEDLVTQHDGTVRDARMNICQFKYGEDGLSSTKVETQGLPLHTMKEEDLKALITMNGIVWADVLSVPRVENAEMVNAFLEQIIEDRAMLVNGVFRNGRAKGLMGPMNLDRMIVSLKVKFNLSATAKTDLTPEYVYERLADLQKRTQPYHRMWAAMLRFHLGPHNTVVKHRMTQLAFNALIEQILVKNWAAWAQPGEQVGIIAAQSIGEPATQMSAIASSFVIIEKHGSVYSGPIGTFIDDLLTNSKVKTLGPDSVVLDLEEPMKIIGVSTNEKTSWREISQISRHPANGGLVEVHTRSGRKTTATLTHSFLKRSKEGIVPVLGSDLTVGMRIPVARYIPTMEKPLAIAKQGSTVFTLNKEFGWVCGIYLADGCLNGTHVNISKIAPIVETRLSAFAKKHGMQFSTLLYKGQYGPSKTNSLKSKDLKDFLKATFGEGSFTKGVGSLAYAAPLTFIQGIIGGFFDGDGNISVSKQLIRASSRSKTLLQGINRLLGYCSMFGVLGEETSVRIPDAVQYTLTIPRKFARLYQNTIGFELPEKAKSLIDLVKYTEREDAHNTQEMIDKIPELGTAIATVGRLLGLPGQSRTYGRWAKKESIGRLTLETYMNTFRAAVRGLDTVSSELASSMAALESALDADVLWDEIVNLVYLDDPKTFVYDFTVPGNDSFMVDDSILVHNTLNTFHLAGVAAKSGMTRGVPRLKELFKVTKAPKAKSLSIFLKPEFRENKEKAREVAQDLELTMLRDIVKSLALYYDPSDDATVIEEDKDLLKFYKFFETRTQGEEPAFSRWMLRMEFNRDMMFNRNITMDDVAYVLNEKFSGAIHMIYTDFNTEKLIMRFRIPENDKYLESKDDYVNFKKLQSNLLSMVVVRGVIGIKATSFSKYENRVELVDGNPTKITEYTIDTDGSNFIEVMNHPAVDPTRLYTTHVHDILDIFGIEAARAILFSEIDSLFTDAGVNYRHLGLLVDTMTRNGRLMSVDRYGINKNAIGPLAKASFEETEKILLRAALFGEMDPVTGVSSKIMTGQPIRGGTTFTHLLLDEAALLRLQKGLPGKKEAEEEDVDDLDEEDIARELAGAADDKCNVVRLRMNSILPESDVTLEEPDVELNIMDA
jgi:DNA-directed RNA polymerase II subunit RPB1